MIVHPTRWRPARLAACGGGAGRAITNRDHEEPTRGGGDVPDVSDAARGPQR